MLSHHIPRGPGGLQIEAAGDGIDVEHLAGKEEVRAHLALQGMQVDVAEADAAAGNKLLLEGFTMNSEAAALPLAASIL